MSPRSLLVSILPALALLGCSSTPARTAVDSPPVPPAPAPAPSEAAADAPVRHAAPHDPEPYANINKRFDLSVGGALLRNFDTTVRVFGPNGSGGAFLDLEGLLNVDEDSSIVRVDSTYSFNRKHSLALSFYDIGRSGTVGLQEDLDVGTVTIPASNVTTSFDTTIVKLSYRYDFVRDTRTNIGASFGFHYMGLDFAMNSNLGPGFEESFRADLPLPLIGLHYQYALSPTWELYTSVEFLQVDLGFLRGHVRDARLGVNHNPFEHFGWGIGYNGFAMYSRFDASDDLDAEVEYGFQGLMLYLRTFF